MIRTYRYRIYPAKKQEQILNDHLAICCELYNAGLQERGEAWARERKRISWFDQNLQLKEIRATRPDVAAVSSTALQDALRRVSLAFQGFLGRVKACQKAGYPRFRSQHRYDSLTFSKIGHAITGKTLYLSKIGHVKIRLHRPIGSTDIKTITVKREGGRWVALLAIEIPPQPLPFNPNAVGIDVGLSSFATLSNGTSIENPRWFRAAQAKLRRLQRRVARRKKGSTRRRKALLLLQRFHNHVRDQRRDFHHRESRKIIESNGLIAVEDLNVKGLASGMLSKAVRDAAWTSFLFMLAYKAESAGRVFVKVDPRGTSQTCICGAEVRKTLAVRQHQCGTCGFAANRDHVSARIILGRVAPSGVNVGELSPCVV